jgi:uncharacterized membrane protein
VAGIAAVWATYRLGRLLLGDRRIALAGAALLAVNPFAIHYAGEARPYALFRPVDEPARLLHRADPGDAPRE